MPGLRDISRPPDEWCPRYQLYHICNNIIPHFVLIMLDCHQLSSPQQSDGIKNQWSVMVAVMVGGDEGLLISYLSPCCPSCHSVVVWRTRQGKDDGASNNRAAELINQSQSLDTTPPVIDQTSIYLHHLHHPHLHHLQHHHHLHHLQLILPDNITTIAVSLESEILF